MGSDDIFKKRREERKPRKENSKIMYSSNWLVVCEGKQTEPNYFTGAIDAINETIKEDKYKLKVEVKGMGMNTLSLVKSVDDIISNIEKCKNSIIPYDKVFVVFDKDSFTKDSFDNAVYMCKEKGYIPLWSNQAIEYWFLLHFNHIDSHMDRTLYQSKLNEYFKKAKLEYKYKKNDKTIYSKLIKYGSLEEAKNRARNIYFKNRENTPSNSESCTTVYKFFDEIDSRLEELK